jgi:hypothetical protein
MCSAASRSNAASKQSFIQTDESSGQTDVENEDHIASFFSKNAKKTGSNFSERITRQNCNSWKL